MADIKYDIKENFKESLKYTTVNDPRFGFEQSHRASTGKTKSRSPFLNSMIRGTRAPYGEPQNIAVSGYGSWLEPRRNGNSKPQENAYIRKRAEQKRSTYIGPYTINGGETKTYNTIPSENINRSKREGRYLLDKREFIQSIVQTASSKMVQDHSPLPIGTPDKTRPVSIQSKDDKKMQTLNKERLESIRIENDPTIVNKMRTKEDFLKDINHLRSSVATNVQDETQINNTNKTLYPTNFQSIYGDIAPSIQNLNLTQDRPNLLAMARNHQETKILNTMILWDQAIYEYYTSKVPLKSSRFLTQEQKSLLDEFKRTGMSEDNIINTIKKSNQLILKGLNQREYSLSSIPLDQIIQHNRKMFKQTDWNNYHNFYSVSTEHHGDTKTYFDKSRQTSFDITDKNDWITTGERNTDYINTNTLYKNTADYDKTIHMPLYKENGPSTKIQYLNNPNLGNPENVQERGHIYTFNERSPQSFRTRTFGLNDYVNNNVTLKNQSSRSDRY